MGFQKSALFAVTLFLIVSSIFCLDKVQERKSAEEEFLKNRPHLKAITAPKCNEVSGVVPGFFPWYRPRLSTDIVPIAYDLDILIPIFQLEFYISDIDMHLQVNKNTSWLIVHEKSGESKLSQLVDKDGVDVNVECIDRFAFNDYLIVKAQFTTDKSPYTASFLTGREYLPYDSGMYEFEFGQVGARSKMLVTRFEPIQAREIFPCFDEPGFKVPVTFQVEHPNDTIVAFNTERTTDEPIPGVLGGITSKFKKTPPLPISLIGFAAFYESDFSFEELEVDENTKMRLWARKGLVEDGYAKEPLKEAVDIYKNLLDAFSGVDISEFPSTINILAVPEYPVDAIPHLGLVFIKENKLLYKSSGASQENTKNTGLLLAKNLAEFWFGNYITFGWWDELWLQEGISDYLKFNVLGNTYAEWLVKPQYISDELVDTLFEDGYPSSHPIQKPVDNPLEIKEYFDVVEISKAAGLFHMLEGQFTEAEIRNALKGYLNAHPWGVADIKVFYQQLGNYIDFWTVEDFFKRYVEQPNYPLLNIEIVNNTDDTQSIHIKQSRFLVFKDSFFDTEDLYPSAYDWTWILQVKCIFGDGTTNNNGFRLKEFYISEKESTLSLNFTTFRAQWVHCNQGFHGVYATQYSVQNWEYLAEALNNKFNGLEQEDHAAIIHNAFVNSFVGILPYKILTEVLSFVSNEQNYVPWRTLYYHVDRLLNLLQYKKTFFQVSNYFIDELAGLELDIADEKWEPAESPVEYLIKETLINLACKVQDKTSLDIASAIWNINLESLFTGEYNETLFPPHTREVVYKYHIQNTYKVDDWDLLLRDYVLSNDVLEQSRYLNALTFTRLPWLLNQFIKSQANGELNNLDIFTAIEQLAQHPLGRETAWDWIRINDDQIRARYGKDDPRIGKMLLDISRTFENEFLYAELLEYFTGSPSGADGNARFKALEYAQSNAKWIEDKEDEVAEAFSGRRTKKASSDSSSLDLFLSMAEKQQPKAQNPQNEITLKKVNELAAKYIADVKAKKLEAKNRFKVEA